MNISVEVDFFLCPICHNDPKDLSHLFFSCVVAQENWRRVGLWIKCGFLFL